jgi:hypothetical protein
VAAEHSTSTANERNQNHRKRFSSSSHSKSEPNIQLQPHSESPQEIRPELNGRTKTEKNEKLSNRGQSPQSPQAETIGRFECRDRPRIRKGGGQCLSLLSHARAGKTKGEKGIAESRVDGGSPTRRGKTSGAREW